MVLTGLHLFLLLPALASSRFIAGIYTFDNLTAIVDAKGSHTIVISDNDQHIFGLTDESLKESARRNTGGIPQFVYLHSPTLPDDPYVKLGWPEVKRTLYTVEKQIISVKTTELSIGVKTYKGVPGSTNYFTVSFDKIREPLANTFEAKWLTGASFDVRDEVYFYVNGTFAVNATVPWGINVNRSKSMIFKGQPVFMALDPTQVVEATLYATKLTVKAKIEYTAVLNGSVACRYYTGVKRLPGEKPPYHSFDINVIMKAGGIASKLQAELMITSEYYTSGKITVKNVMPVDYLPQIQAVITGPDSPVRKDQQPFPLLPALAPNRFTAGIYIFDNLTALVDAKGNHTNVISDNDQLLFGLTDRSLKDSAEKNTGGTPQFVYLHSPTRPDDPYEKLGWSEVKRSLYTAEKRIISVETTELSIGVKTYKGAPGSTTFYNVSFDSIQEPITNTFEARWLTGGSFDVTDDIFYNVDGAFETNVTVPWGVNVSRSKDVIYKGQPVSVSLDPTKVIEATLYATKVTVIAKIEYTAELSGSVACRYYRGVKRLPGEKPPYHAFDINVIMRAGGIATQLQAVLLITIEYYNSGRIALENITPVPNLATIRAEITDPDSSVRY